MYCRRILVRRRSNTCERSRMAWSMLRSISRSSACFCFVLAARASLRWSLMRLICVSSSAMPAKCSFVARLRSASVMSPSRRANLSSFSRFVLVISATRSSIALPELLRSSSISASTRSRWLSFSACRCSRNVRSSALSSRSLASSSASSCLRASSSCRPCFSRLSPFTRVSMPKYQSFSSPICASSSPSSSRSLPAFSRSRCRMDSRDAATHLTAMALVAALAKMGGNLLSSGATSSASAWRRLRRATFL
mmetsp:Transcript_24830/g.86472  ORF Transcript_24830/g.86472 Transcript_24830/m.86472 type:complete len:251 (+) Transcript_24830:264-1016(+)